MCFSPTCTNYILLLGNVEDLLQNLNASCFTYQQVDCLYRPFKYRFKGNIVVTSGQVFDNVQRAVYFFQKIREKERMPSIAKKRILRKKYRKHLLSLFQKTRSTQTSGSVFAGKIEQVKEQEFELTIIKIVNCFVDGYGSYSSKIVTFEIEIIQTHNFMRPMEILRSEVVVPTK